MSGPERRTHPGAVLVASVFVVWGCKSAPEPVPQAQADDASDILDAPIPASQRPAPRPTMTEAMLVLPETPQKPAIETDGQLDDWKGKKWRQFRTKSSVESGTSFWKGQKDSSFRVAIDADEGFLYVAVDVTDDAVVETPMGADPTDGVVVWLRDPGLDALGNALPHNVGLDEYVDAETAILFLPNGRVEAYGGRDELDFGTIMFHEVARTGAGYTVEAALKLEAFEEISSIPLPEVAFRVEVLDGDEPSRPGYQTMLSTTPDRGDDAPRMAVFTAGGLLPHAPLGAPPPRLNAIGRWRFEEGRWGFASFEVVPRTWVTLDDIDGFQTTLREADALSDRCAAARKDVVLVEAYQSRGGGFRTGLVVCGHRTVEGKCPASAETSVLLVMLQEQDDTWRVQDVVDVLPEPARQCTSMPVKGEPMYADFALYPLDVLGPSVWVAGWTRTVTTPELVDERFEASFLNTKYELPRLGTTTTRHRKLTPEERTISTSSVYLTYVDEDDNVDICQVEQFVEQGCDGLDRGCVTYEHGKTLLTNIQMWSAKKRKFERYELSKHPGCTAAFDFSDARGYLLLQLRNRIGLLPSPRSNEGADSDKLDIF